MHRLVPVFVTDNLRRNRMRGSFDGGAIFVDISGFTPLTERLMTFGQHGAEVLAGVMRKVFTPLVRTVFGHGGFVTNFAGDAFSAVFPAQENDPALASLNALAAAWQIQQHMKDNARQVTRFGSFEFSAKVGVAAGPTEWGIILSADNLRAAYYFKGSAINGCTGAEKFARAGDVIIDRRVYKAARLRINAQGVDNYWRVARVTATFPEPETVQIPPPDIEKMALFGPRLLFEQEVSGEFRQILSLFISLQGSPHHEELSRFMQHLFALQQRYGGFMNRVDYGDKGCHLLLFWGAPVSYENDITRLLDFILELRQLSDIPLRAGITNRIAHAGYIGSSLAEEFTSYGRGVNLAARHMVSAGWGEIWLDGETAKRAEKDFRLHPLGEKLFKGISDPQPVFLLEERHEQIVSPYGADPMIGRQQELSELEEALQPLKEGRFAGVVTVSGEAGIGKSHLVHSFLDATFQSSETALFICQT
ncbi:MAG: adenylate/guanylate cyclase domain-containing protein, partial [Candidatus Promineifilaceae bacterium]|nr:adenylate/guanylate cyclase domain-containing protein [Candidatus Promineifilaceae bacterium]